MKSIFYIYILDLYLTSILHYFTFIQRTHLHNTCEERSDHPGPDSAADRAPEQDLRHGRAPRPHELLPDRGGHRQAGEEVLKPQGDHPHLHTIPLSKVPPTYLTFEVHMSYI